MPDQAPPGFNLDAEKAAADALAKGGVPLGVYARPEPEPEFDGEEPDPQISGAAAYDDDQAVEDPKDNEPIGDI